MRVCLLCFPPNHSVSITLYQSKPTCEFACLASRPNIAFCTALYQNRQTHTLLPAQPSRLASRYTKAGKLASLPAFLPTQPYRWHRAIPKQANLRLLCFPPNHSVLHRAIPKQANLQVCLLSFPPNHSVLHHALPKQATLRVCVLSFPPNHSVAGRRAGGQAGRRAGGQAGRQAGRHFETRVTGPP